MNKDPVKTTSNTIVDANALDFVTQNHPNPNEPPRKILYKHNKNGDYYVVIQKPNEQTKISYWSDKIARDFISNNK